MVDDPILNTRELIYAARDLSLPSGEADLVDALICSVLANVAALAHIVAREHNVTVTTWTSPDANEACFTGTDAALKKLAKYEGSL